LVSKGPGGVVRETRSTQIPSELAELSAKRESSAVWVFILCKK